MSALTTGTHVQFRHIAEGLFEAITPPPPRGLYWRLHGNAARRTKTHVAAREIALSKLREWRREQVLQSDAMRWLNGQCRPKVWDPQDTHWWAGHIVEISKRDVAALFKLTFVGAAE